MEVFLVVCNKEGDGYVMEVFAKYHLAHAYIHSELNDLLCVQCSREPIDNIKATAVIVKKSLLNHF